MTFLKLENISKKIGQNSILKKINWEINERELMVLVGPSGCGKTTLLKVILGVLKPDKGSIYINQKKINDIPISERNIGFVPQDFGLFPHLTVNENIAYGLKVQGYEKQVINSRVSKLIDKLKLNNLEKRKIDQLSWGQQQRVALARSLAIQPCLLLLDEPLSSVDWIARRNISKELKRLQKEFKITVIYVTHDIDEAFELGDKITVMNAGKLEQCGTPINLIHNPKTEFVSSFVRQKKSLKRTRMVMDLTGEI
ncbi:MAG: ABC transporter ATP-binding protein [Promethearchaeia archaeon]